jgi:hypothetical protein
MADNNAPAPADGGAADAVAKLHLDDVTGEMISKTELKRRQKVRDREASKKEKNASKPAPPAGQNAKKEKNAEAAEKDLSPNQVCSHPPISPDYPLARINSNGLLTLSILAMCSTSRFDRGRSMSFTPRARLTHTRYIERKYNLGWQEMALTRIPSST